MTDLYDNLYTAEQSRQIDRLAISAGEVSGYGLMERAGEAAWSVLRSLWASQDAARPVQTNDKITRARTLTVFAGAGNNGGDGYVLARLARAAGCAVMLIATGTPRAGSDAERAARAWRDTGGEVHGWAESNELRAACRAGAVVDGLLGTGLDRALEGDLLACVEAINHTRAQADRPVVLALDVPTGVDSDSGCVRGAAVRADHTVSFITRKRGLYTGDALDYAGKLHFASLGVADELPASAAPSARLVRPGPMLRAWLPPRRVTAHKGDAGHLLVVGGNNGMGGAARLAGEAALRTGAGLVTLAVHPNMVGQVAAGRPELMVHGVATESQLGSLLERASALVVGPGLGQDEWARQMLTLLWSTPRVGSDGLPVLLDADALNLLAAGAVAGSPGDAWIITPHPGEARRLLGSEAERVDNDRFAAAARLQERYGGVAVLKGAGTLVAAGDAPTAVNGTGNPGMASGGMGDALSGIIGALLAQGLPPRPAAELGVALHGAAGDQVALESGARGMLASDLIARLPPLVNFGLPEFATRYPGGGGGGAHGQGSAGAVA